MIVKLQRPLFSMERNPLWLAYDEKDMRRFYLATSLIPIDTLTSMATDAKGYFNAEIVEGRLEIGDRVEDQPW